MSRHLRMTSRMPAASFAPMKSLGRSIARRTSPNSSTSPTDVVVHLARPGDGLRSAPEGPSVR